jgi:ABC-type antimicrobial peptide transport system permease subunit
MKEIALRMALGVMPSGVLRLLFGLVVAQVMVGLALGVAGAYALGQVLQGMRATRIDPLAILRSH